MKITGIEISNFKRLHDVRLDLSASESNLAFVNGTNGNGKSSFLNAFRWCFFGEPISTGHFSYAELKELNSGEISNISVQVRLKLNQKGDSATIRRDQPVRISKSGTESDVEFLGPEDLTVTISYANTAVPSEIVPDGGAWLEANFPQRFKRFILFDGELMYKFFDLSVKGAIEDAVREIAKIDLFDDVISRVQEILSRNNQKVAKLSGTAAEKIEDELQSRQNLYNDLISRIRLKRQEKDDCLAAISGIQDLLRGKEELESFLEINKSLREELARQQANYAEYDASLSKILLFTGTNSLILNRTKYPVEKQVKEAERTGKYPANFAPEALAELLSEGQCICGRHLDKESNDSAHILKIIEDSKNAGDIGSELKKIEVGVAKVGGMLQESQNSSALVVRELQRTEKEIKRLSKEIAQLQPQLEGVKGNHEDILNLSKNLKTFQFNLTDISKEETAMALKLAVLDEDIRSLTKKFEKALGNSAEVIGLKTKGAFLSKVLDQAANFSDEIISTVRKQLENAIAAKFTNVQGCENYSVVLSENFDVETYNELGKQPELSEGQKMALAYIFSIALREVVGLSFPLIVDTPLGRVSSKNRAMLADSLRDLVTESNEHQVILMMHDGEYSPYTKRDFSSANPIESYLALSENQLESTIQLGIDPDWLSRDAWKDWADGNIKL